MYLNIEYQINLLHFLSTDDQNYMMYYEQADLSLKHIPEEKIYQLIHWNFSEKWLFKHPISLYKEKYLDRYFEHLLNFEYDYLMKGIRILPEKSKEYLKKSMIDIFAIEICKDDENVCFHFNSEDIQKILSFVLSQNKSSNDYLKIKLKLPLVDTENMSSDVYAFYIHCLMNQDIKIKKIDFDKLFKGMNEFKKLEFRCLDALIEEHMKTLSKDELSVFMEKYATLNIHFLSQHLNEIKSINLQHEKIFDNLIKNYYSVKNYQPLFAFLFDKFNEEKKDFFEYVQDFCQSGIHHHLIEELKKHSYDQHIKSQLEIFKIEKNLDIKQNSTKKMKL